MATGVEVMLCEHVWGICGCVNPQPDFLKTHDWGVERIVWRIDTCDLKKIIAVNEAIIR
jgi:hypothetical protein